MRRMLKKITHGVVKKNENKQNYKNNLI